MPTPGFWEILIIALVVILLFGAKKLPDAARSIGRSMRIFKSEVKEMSSDDSNDEFQGQLPQGQNMQGSTAQHVTGEQSANQPNPQQNLQHPENQQQNHNQPNN